MKEIINNIQETNCSFKVSQLLEEKGFDVPCFNVYEKDGTPLFDSFREVVKNSEISKNTFITAPTHSIAVEWIRVNFDINIESHVVGEKGYFSYTVYINGAKKLKERFDTPQEAIEAGLLYALTNLIL